MAGAAAGILFNRLYSGDEAPDPAEASRPAKLASQVSPTEQLVSRPSHSVNPPEEKKLELERQTSEQAGRLVDFGKFSKLLEDPDFVRAFMERDDDAYRKKHYKVFKKLQLSQAQVDRVCAILTEQHMVLLDAAGAAGSPSDPAAVATIKSMEADFNKRLAEIVGVDGVTELRRTDENRWVDEKLGTLERKMAFGPSPLLPAQADKIREVLLSAGPAFGSKLGSAQIATLRSALTEPQFDRFSQWLDGQALQHKVQNKYDK